MKKFILAIFVCLMLTSCKKDENVIKDGEVMQENIKVIINNQEYEMDLEKNATTKELIKMFPKIFNMAELNGNEKYVYLDKVLPTDEYKPKMINKGDVMLYQNNCLVIFYKDFETSYRYTKIGHIKDLDDLDNSNISVTFTIK